MVISPSAGAYSSLSGVNIHAALVVPVSGMLSGFFHASVPATLFPSLSTNKASLNSSFEIVSPYVSTDFFNWIVVPDCNTVGI